MKILVMQYTRPVIIVSFTNEFHKLSVATIMG